MLFFILMVVLNLTATVIEPIKFRDPSNPILYLAMLVGWADYAISWPVREIIHPNTADWIVAVLVGLNNLFWALPVSLVFMRMNARKEVNGAKPVK